MEFYPFDDLCIIQMLLSDCLGCQGRLFFILGKILFFVCFVLLTQLVKGQVGF